MKKDYKVEAKGSLWEISLETGSYSDWNIEHFIFSGNSAEEVWEFVKIWATQRGDEDDFIKGLRWGERKFQYEKKEEWEEIDWNHDSWEVYEVKIKRANVVYVNPIKLLKDN